MLLTGLAVAGAVATAALGGYAVYRGTQAVGSSLPVTKGLLTAAALFVWTALTLPVAGAVLLGSVVVGLAVLPLVLAAAGLSLLVGGRTRRPPADPDTITV